MINQYVFTEPTSITFDKVGIKGRILTSSEISPKTEFLLVNTEKGHQTSIIEHECDFTYYVLSGEGYFLVEDQKYSCETGNLIIIPKNTKFTYKGKLKMLLVVTPPFFPEQEETIND